MSPRLARRRCFAAHGFRDKDWAQKCRNLRWNYGIRVANNTTVTLADGRVLAINTLGIQPGRVRYFQNVCLTAEADWLCNLAMTWTRVTAQQPAELCAIAVATLWIYDIGEFVLRTHTRAEIDPAFKRQLSVFQIGWRQLRHWITCQTSRLPFLTLRLSPFRLAPAWRK